ncbi:hypothetical protein N7453_002916 [Penicillium expansum]|nr:hypothetical protein N7453_002916 [Penicillium expansum]
MQETDGIPWFEAHIHYANMGGFPIQFVDSDPASTREMPSRKGPPKGIQYPQTFQKSMQKISNAIGKTDWELNRSNILATEQANTIPLQRSLKHVPKLQY